jgi:hypothetical protein
MALAAMPEGPALCPVPPFVPLTSLAAEDRIHSIGSPPPHGIGQMRVDVGRGCDAAVAQTSRDLVQVRPGFEEQRRVGVPQIVEALPWQADPRQECLELRCDVATV